MKSSWKALLGRICITSNLGPLHLESLPPICWYLPNLLSWGFWIIRYLNRYWVDKTSQVLTGDISEEVSSKSSARGHKSNHSHHVTRSSVFKDSKRSLVGTENLSINCVLIRVVQIGLVVIGEIISEGSSVEIMKYWASNLGSSCILVHCVVILMKRTSAIWGRNRTVIIIIIILSLVSKMLFTMMWFFPIRFRLPLCLPL